MKAEGVTPRVAKIVLERDGQCVARVTHPGRAKPGQQIHHRRPRAMGGTRVVEVNAPANLIHLCSDCHGWIEVNRDKARVNGWLVSQREDPATVPLLYLGRWMFLTDSGQVKQFLETPWEDGSGAG